MVEQTKKYHIRKGIKIGCGISALLLMGFLGSYAYFIGTVVGNRNEELSVQAGNMALRFADGNPGITNSLEFGSSVEKIFTIENTGTLDAFAKINFVDLVNTYIEGSLTYTLSFSETEDGIYKDVLTNENVPRSESSSIVELANGLEIPVGAKYYYKLTITLNYLDDVDQTEDLNAILSTHFRLEEGTKVYTSNDTLTKLNLAVKEEEPNFTVAATTDETANGLYSLEDDYGISYYYRGAVENNYVKFADMFWRIIRINGDGSLRIVYDGDKAYANNELSSNRFIFRSKLYNSYSNDAKYVGYMFGGKNGEASLSREQAHMNEVDSAIKKFVDAWYEENIENKNYSKYISDTIFCNDRSVVSGSGFGTDVTYYGPYERFVTNSASSKPLFKCVQKNDAFTVSDTKKGNGKLSYPIGLMTIDEAVAAGNGIANTVNTKYYLYKQNVSYFWTMSPVYYNNGTYVFDVNGRDDLGAPTTFNDMSTAPVINIKPEYVQDFIGTGTMVDPYRFS